MVWRCIYLPMRVHLLIDATSFHRCMKNKNGRIPSHRASQNSSMAPFGSKFDFLEVCMAPVHVLIDAASIHTFMCIYS